MQACVCMHECVCVSYVCMCAYVYKRGVRQYKVISFDNPNAHYTSKPQNSQSSAQILKEYAHTTHTHTHTYTKKYSVCGFQSWSVLLATKSLVS